MPQGYIVEVTQEDISKGVPAQPFSCPIARAFMRGHGKRVSVGPEGIEIYQCAEGPLGEFKTFNLPSVAQEFVSRFDSRKPVEPFWFYLDVTPRSPMP